MKEMNITAKVPLTLYLKIVNCRKKAGLKAGEFFIGAIKREIRRLDKGREG